MEFRLAEMADLERLKEMYEKIIEDMNSRNMKIWDDVFPCEFLAGDIENKELYILIAENKEIVSSFALSTINIGPNEVPWENIHSKALYFGKFGVNLEYARQGIGRLMINKAIEVAKEKNGEFFRLFVVHINAPAINLYEKIGLKQIEGLYEEKVDDDFSYFEYAFEMKI